MEFFLYVESNEAISVDLTQFGYGSDEAVPVYDIWEKKDVGSAMGSISSKVPHHGVKLFRLGDNKANAIDEQGFFVPSSSQMQGSGTSHAQGIYDFQGRNVSSLSQGFYLYQGKKIYMK